MISMIVAADLNNGIGIKNKLLCSLPDDMKNFKALTTGNAVIMGRMTWQSLPDKFRPLPNRINIVLSKKMGYTEDCIVVSSIHDALKECNKHENVFVIGGGEIYEKMLPHTEKLYLTRIQHLFEADTFFPDLSQHDWELQSSHTHGKDDNHKYPFTIEIYNRI
jgi:dihydrofolate reductase